MAAYLIKFFTSAAEYTKLSLSDTFKLIYNIVNILIR